MTKARNLSLLSAVEAAATADQTKADLNAIGVSGGRKNLIINGRQQIDQRNSGAAITCNTWSHYPSDRFRVSIRTSTAVATAQQVTDAPEGFSHSVKITRVSSATPASSDYCVYNTKVEGYDMASTDIGESTAKTVTGSFWVKSSLIGTYSYAFQNENGSARTSYISEYTIDSANTWEKKSITIPLQTSGDWYTDNRGGLAIIWGLGGGSSYQTSTLNAWVSTNTHESSNQVDFMDTASATWQITGVQLELGSVATDFEHRSYGEELALCQRYYYRLNVIANQSLMIGNSLNTTSGFYTLALPQPLRATPSVSISGFTNYRQRGGGVNVTTTVTLGTPHYTVGNSELEIDITVSSGLPNTIQTMVFTSTGSTGYLDADSEL